MSRVTEPEILKLEGYMLFYRLRASETKIAERKHIMDSIEGFSRSFSLFSTFELDAPNLNRKHIMDSIEGFLPPPPFSLSPPSFFTFSPHCFGRQIFLNRKYIMDSIEDF